MLFCCGAASHADASIYESAEVQITLSHPKISACLIATELVSCHLTSAICLETGKPTKRMALF